MSARPKLRLVHAGKWRATSQKYLQWLDSTGSWRFRRVVPKHLRAVIGKTEWTETLKARTENEAIRLMQPQIAGTDRTVALAEAGNWPPIPDEDVHDLAFAWWTGEPDAQTLSSSEISRSVERFLVGPRTLGGWLQNSPLLKESRERVVAILDDADRNTGLRRNTDAMARLLRECRRNWTVHALQHGGVEPLTVIRPVDANGPLAQFRHVAAPTGVPVMFAPLSLGGNEAPDGSDLVSKWAKEAAPDVRWLYQARLTMRKLAAFVEHDDATRVTRRDVIGFKEQLAQKGLKPPTINRYLSELKGPFQWACDNEKIGSDPSTDVVFQSKAREKRSQRIQ